MRTKLTKTVLTWQTQEKEKKKADIWPAKVFQNHEIDEKSTDIFFNLFLVRQEKYCLSELGPNHVSKFQVRTRINERSTAILACFERLGRPSLYSSSQDVHAQKN